MTTDQPATVHDHDGSPSANSVPDAPVWTFYDNFVAFPHASMMGNTDERVFAEVVVSLDDPDGGTHGEFKVRWYEFSHGDFAARLEAFTDAWAVLRDGDLLGIMRGLDNPTPNQFMDRLRAAGYTDRTAALSSPSNPCPTCYSRPFEGRWGALRIRERVESAAQSRQIVPGGSDA